MTPSAPSTAAAVLTRRLLAVQDVLSPGPRPVGEQPAAMDVLVGLARTVHETRDPAAAWLVVVALAGAMPDQALVRSVTRALVLKQPEDAVVWLLDAVAPLAMDDGDATAELRIVTDHPLVDVDATAKSDFLTGIQRVVREVMRQWDRRHDVEVVVWSSRGGCYRPLRDVERNRLLRQEVEAFDPAAMVEGEETRELVVPWGVPVVLFEVPAGPMNDRLAAMAELTAGVVRLVGYDCIPVASAETVPLVEPEKFGRYLELVKHADRVAGISRSAADEFRGFTRALTAQGLPGPRVVSCPLPDTTPMQPGVDDVDGPPPRRPVVLCIGTVGRRKNQVVLVEAAEVLWREGLDFEVRILGHLGSERTPLTGLVPELQEQGRPLVVEAGVSDARIAESLAHARCLVFPTLHEGFGLPVAEALSHGVPVITSDFGSAREIAEDRGGLLVDPEDVGAVTDALRLLLVDDAAHARLAAQARDRPTRTWTTYATELWEALLA